MVTFHIKLKNETYINMLANALLLHTPLIPGLESKDNFFYSESSHDACQVNRKEAENPLQANIPPFYTPTTSRWVKRTNIFSEDGHVAYQLKGIEV